MKLPIFTLPSLMTVFFLILLTYFMVVSYLVYDVIVEPLGIGFMFVLDDVGIILLDLALDKNRAKNVKVSYASTGE
ncbi:oligosaccharyltransferase complex subunit OSTC [Tripterygium wilfordii]|uniref:Oligosaccharyltransferase complex subunit OSTC n=1 Tax=Tripterygium wilfordii TaxID=458696 RepID=A0A7J7C9K9_TRIWF|nr:oligosaccharyltransferase complex subunit OSTC-like [Tripterygium wilfordii]KAF5730809.1 oligosaccharyltransferase complex subunit OSTC [Tripterygium wilfordii]